MGNYYSLISYNVQIPQDPNQRRGVDQSRRKVKRKKNLLSQERVVKAKVFHTIAL